MPKHQIYTIDTGERRNTGIQNHAMIPIDYDERHVTSQPEILQIEIRPASCTSDESSTSGQLLYQHNLDVYVKNRESDSHNNNNNNNNNNNSLTKIKNKQDLLCRHMIDIHRNALDLNEFQKQTGSCIESRKHDRKEREYYDLIKKTLPKPWNFLSGLFPILNWSTNYNLKRNLFHDIIAGFTVAILHIPQGIAYALLAGLEPVHGLYVSFFPVLIYSLMGTSAHISIGTFSIASIMLNNIALKVGATTSSTSAHLSISLFETNQTINNQTLSVIESASSALKIFPPPTILEVLTSVCLLCGLIQVIMGFLRLGSLSLILSEQLVSAYSTAIAFHVATSQFVYIFGFENLPRVSSGPYKLYRCWKQIFENIQSTNINALTLTIILVSILLIFGELIEPRMKKHCRFPVPIDLIVVVLSIVFSYLLNFDQVFNIQVVKTVPTGLPQPTMPRIDLFKDVFVDTCILAIVCFAVSLSLAKIFAKKHKYSIDANQELIALGSSNVFASFFAAFPCSAALSRSTLQEKVGGRTQIAGLVSSTIILAVLLLFAPYLYHLPKCTLSCIILVALKGMFMQIGDLPTFCRISRLDGLAWFVTFASTIILDIDLGLIVGISTSVIVILIRLAVPKMYSLGNLEASEIYSETKGFPGLEMSPNCRIVRFSAPLFYMNAERFKSGVFEQFENQNRHNDCDDETEHCSHNMNSTNDDQRPFTQHRTLILDLSAVAFIDKTGIDALVEVVKVLTERDIQTKLASVPYHVLKLLNSIQFFERVSINQFYCRIYPTVHDAVVDSA